MWIFVVFKSKILQNILASYVQTNTNYPVYVVDSDQKLGDKVKDIGPHIFVVDSAFTGRDVDRYYNTMIRPLAPSSYLVVVETMPLAMGSNIVRLPKRVKVISVHNDEDFLLLTLKMLMLSDIDNRQMPGRTGALTVTESKVVSLIMAGKTTNEISSILRVSAETVKNHRKSVKTKLGVRGGKKSLIEYLLS